MPNSHKTIFSLISLIIIIGLSLPTLYKYKKRINHKAYSCYIQGHPYSKRPHYTKSELKLIPKKDRPDLAWEQDFLATMDPDLKRPTPEKLFAIYEAKALEMKYDQQGVPGSATNWTERGVRPQ